ncbi:MAG: hypothetical protein L0H78_25355, partial [Humibacillus sp.]|nr:hypothetical protein [Humibacillus sp.]
RFHPRCPKARHDCVVTLPILEPVLGDEPTHCTACLHPLAVGEDLTLSTPAIDDSEILLVTDRAGSAPSTSNQRPDDILTGGGEPQ